MKKQLCMMVAACGLLSLASCSDDENVIVNDQPIYGDEEQVITLDVQQTDILSTKSRPLYSTVSKGAESVTDVVLFILKEDEEKGNYQIVNRIPINDWLTQSTEYRYGHKYTIKLDGTKYEKLGEGEYVIVAVGQDEDTNSDNVPEPMKVMTSLQQTFASTLVQNLADETNGYPTTNNVALSTDAYGNPGTSFLATDSAKYLVERNEVAYAGTGHAVSEIFSGISNPINLTATGTKGFVATVLLKRQVAGVIGYFNNIPAKIPYDASFMESTAQSVAKDDSVSVASIRLVASKRYTNIDLAYNLGDQKDDMQEVGDERVVNGFIPTWDNYTATNSTDADAWFGTGARTAEAKLGYVIYQINLAEWFRGAGTENEVPYGDGTTKKGSFWPHDAYTHVDGEMPLLTSATDVWHNPYNPANEATEGDGNASVKPGSVLAGEFVIPFDRTTDNVTFQLQLMDSTNTVVLRTWDVHLDENSISSTASGADRDTEEYYSIYRNHLYQVGQRGGGDAGKEDDEDIPQPLDNSQTLMIRINDNWEAIHNMVIE